MLALALRVIEFLLPGFHVDVGVRQLAVIDFRLGDGEAGNGALHRHVAEIERGQAFRREAVHRVHGDAVAVRVDELLVDPVTAALGELVETEFAGGEHHLAQIAVQRVAIDVDIGKIVVGANLLDLPESALQSPPVPEADVLQRGLVVRQGRRRPGWFRRETLLV